ncbi:hypothetical protein OPQ81_010934 [Rhizoctonia solani]|nr:hypothetical protein OPQ81_010934 [Rhizoctonia solani]
MEATTQTSDKPPEVLPRHSACLLCRNRKVKCDGGQPNCGRCRASDQVCKFDKIKDIENKIRAIEQSRGSCSSLTSQTRSINSPPVSSPMTQQTPLSSPTSEACTTSPTPLVYDSISNLLDSDFASYPPSGCPWIEAAISQRLASEGLDIPPNTLKNMLAIFVHRRGLSGYKLHMGRVLNNLITSSKPVLALLYAMLLTACHFAQDVELKSWESALLERTNSEIETNIVPAHQYGRGEYNCLYHLQAMLILSQYYYFKSRMLEGHVQTNNTTRFAVGMGIHQLNSRRIDDYKSKPSGKSGLQRERWQPRDSIELGEAINLLWGCVARDLVGGIVNGLPPYLSLEEITTVWPLPLTTFVENLDLPKDHYSVKELLDPDFSDVLADVSRDNAACLLIKVLVLIHYAGQLDTERFSKQELSHEWWARFNRYDRAIQRVAETLPPFGAGRDPEEFSHLVLAHTTIDCATLQLHGMLADHELKLEEVSNKSNRSLGGYSYARCVAACRKIASVTAYIEGIDLSYMHMFIAVTWICAGNALAKYISILRENNCNEEVHSMEQDMLVIDRNMELFLNTYPIFNAQVERLRAIRNW